MAEISSKGVILDSNYQVILQPHPRRYTTEFINHGTGTAYITINSEGDENAIEISPEASYNSTTPLTGTIRARGAGKLVIVAGDQS